MITFIATAVVFGVLVTIHEWGHFIVAKYNGVRVEEFSIGFGPVLFRKQWHDTEYLLCLLPLGGYVKMAGDVPSGTERTGANWEFLSKSPWQRMQVVMAGPLINYAFALVIFIGLFFFGSPTHTTEIGGFIADSPAQVAGLQAGDVITAINGVAVDGWQALTETLQKSPAAHMEVGYRRDEEEASVLVNAIKKAVPTLSGEEKEVFVLGITPGMSMQKERYPFGESVVLGTQKLYTISALTYRSLWRIVTGKMSFKESMTGPLGIIFITGKTAKQGIVYLVHLMGLLSAALALFNFLPIPVLDGGHFAMYLFELVFRRPVPLAVQTWGMRIGIVFLVGLMVIVFYNDIIRFNIWDKVMGFFHKLF